MAGREKAAAEIADDLETLGRELRAEFNRAVRTIAPVTFSGPVAQLFDRRLRRTSPSSTRSSPRWAWPPTTCASSAARTAS